MTNLIVVDDPSDWQLAKLRGAVVAARDYLDDPKYQRGRHRIYNLCRSYRYQSIGYYVSLLAAARGHRPIPDVITIQDLKESGAPALVSEEVETLLQRSLAPIRSDHFVLSIYFGANPAKRHDRLSSLIFDLLPAPLLRAEFKRRKHWQITSLRPIAVSDVPRSHRAFLQSQVLKHFGSRHRRRAVELNGFALGILVAPDEAEPPSNAAALRRFLRAARRQGFDGEFIGKEDYGRIAQFDALFIRTTTNVNHFSYRFARRAETEGVVVIDDADSIVRCSNKVYLAEVAQKHGLPVPPTLLIARGRIENNVRRIIDTLGLPCVIKQPDSAFSVGVVKADSEKELKKQLRALLEKSELVVAQAFSPTDFDWRIGVLAGTMIFACRYAMAPRHWQIYRRSTSGRVVSGDSQTVALADVPKPVRELALAAAAGMGTGLYGVDIKQTANGGVILIEVNDNPNIDRGIEDAVAGDALYDAVIGELRRRVLALRDLSDSDGE